MLLTGKMWFLLVFAIMPYQSLDVVAPAVASSTYASQEECCKDASRMIPTMKPKGDIYAAVCVEGDIVVINGSKP